MNNLPMIGLWRRDRVTALSIFLLILNLVVWGLALAEACDLI